MSLFRLAERARRGQEMCSFRKARLVCAEKEDHSLIVSPSGRNVEDTQKIF